MIRLLCCLLLSIFYLPLTAQTPIWSKLELTFLSSQAYNNPLYDLKEFSCTFQSPTGITHKIAGFWDGGQTFRVRFAPDELGTWTYETSSSNTQDTRLHGQKGQFEVIANSSPHAIYQKGSIQHRPGNYYLSHADGTPFFFVGCTAWNGALKSTEAEWEEYLNQRRENHYSVIQFVTTQWRGCEKDQDGEVAFTGSGRISLNPAFFQRLDAKVDRINAHGLIAAPVLLWALPFGQGREFSPGYYLPQEEAILLAKYLVARYGGNQVIWILGGDGRYILEYEQRWKEIGRAVFGQPHPGIVAQHPHGSSWIGEAYRDESWLDVVGYQSSHNNGERVVNWINKGPMATQWDQLPAKPIINLEPNYEEIQFRITAEDVRNASYWSLFATPPSGITYGANGIWPWIQKDGDLIENHGNPDGRSPSTWKQSIAFPGSLQIGYLSAFFQQYAWWELKPASGLLAEQAGDTTFNHFISVLADDRQATILTYTPIRQPIKLRLAPAARYRSRWFDPVAAKYLDARGTNGNGITEFTPPTEQDYILVLEKER